MNKNTQRYNVAEVDGIINRALEKGRLPVPFAVKGVNERNFDIISSDDFSPRYMFESYQNYSATDMLMLQYKRNEGNKNEEETKHGILTVYAMMFSGIVTVSDGSAHKTRLFTLNPQLARWVCDEKSVQYTMREIKENYLTLNKNEILCIELVPEEKDGKWVYETEKALYKLKSNQIVTYVTSVQNVRQYYFELLSNNIVTFQYFDTKEKELRRFTTSLSHSVLSGVMKAEVMKRVIKESHNETRLLTLRLPDLGDKEHSNMVDLFIPNIVHVKYMPEAHILRGEFNPYKSHSDKSAKAGSKKA